MDAALGLIRTKGYRQMSIQDVLDELDASRGAFYHYFDSKAALLDAAMDRLFDAGVAIANEVAADPSLPATEKFGTVFTSIASWKNARRDLMVQLLQVWLSDENALVREKLRHLMSERLAPILAGIIAQGCEEGVFHVASPQDAAQVLVAVLVGSQDVAGNLYLARAAGTIPLETVERSFAAFGDAYERILGAPSGSIRIVDEETIRIWFG